MNSPSSKAVPLPHVGHARPLSFASITCPIYRPPDLEVTVSCRHLGGQAGYCTQSGGLRRNPPILGYLRTARCTTSTIFVHFLPQRRNFMPVPRGLGQAIASLCPPVRVRNRTPSTSPEESETLDAGRNVPQMAKSAVPRCFFCTPRWLRGFREAGRADDGVLVPSGPRRAGEE
jgi:hypothetical protein